MLLLGLLVLLGLLGDDDLHSSLLLPLGVGCEFGGDIGGVDDCLLLLLDLGVVSPEVVEVVDEEVDEFDFSQVLLELVLSVPLLVALLVLGLPGLALLVVDLPGLDSALPLEEVDQLFLLPEVVLLLVVLLPDLLVVLPDLDDVGLQLVQSLLLVLLPGLVLLVVPLLLLGLFGLLCVELLGRAADTVLSPVMFSFFLSSSVLMRVNSSSMGSLRALTLVISSSSTSLRSSHCSSFISMFPELSASRSLRFSSMISSLRLFSSALEMSALMSLCSNSSSRSE